MNEKPLVAVIRWNNGNTVAELYPRNEWIVMTNGERDLQTEQNLRAIYADRCVYSGPQEGFYGFQIARDVARIHNGNFRFYTPKSRDNDIAY